MGIRIERRETDDGPRWDLICDCDFTSEGWPMRSEADRRKDQHKAEHDTGEPMPELKDG